MKKPIFGLVTIFVTFLFFNGAYARHRIFWLDSYDPGNAWTHALGMEISRTLKAADVELAMYHMDTKRNPSETFKARAAQKALQKIRQYQPDLMIASDDDASKYVVAPFFKDAKLPIVFCGVNHNGERYGYPYKNVTGIVEQDPLYKLIYALSRFCAVEKFGYLAEDGTAARINGGVYKDQTRFTCVPYYVTTMEDWKKAYYRAQNEVDILIIGNISGIKDWDKGAALQTIFNESRVPTGTLLEFIAPYAFIGCIKLPAEQGHWAADTALKILDGTPVGNIPIAEPRDGKLIVNLKIAKVLGIKVPKSYLDKADQLID
jgi:ABC-type uncharacterized transport system substrate-binding protein